MYTCMFTSISYLCLLCTEAMVSTGGPTAGREGSMEACEPTESRTETTGNTMTTATATLTTDTPGKRIYLQETFKTIINL